MATLDDGLAALRSPRRHRTVRAGREPVATTRRVGRVIGWTVFTVLLVWTGCLGLLRSIEPPTTALIVLRWLEGVPVSRPGFVSTPMLRRAVIAAEDQHFCDERFGIDGGALLTQFGVWRDGGRPGGASTIAMQTGRNLLLWPGRSLLRKPLELLLAAQISQLWSRHQQLDTYLHVAEFGPGLYGIEAASRHWYGLPADRLDALRVARLMELLPAPWTRSPLRLSPEAEARAGSIAGLLSHDGDARFACAL